MKNLFRLIFISIVATLIAGCGGGGGSSDTGAGTTATPTSISQQPVSVEALAGATAVFSVTAAGDGLQYQWQDSQDQGTTWTTIPGAVSASYTVQAAIPELNGYLFRVLVTGTAGSVTSSAATLAVTPAATPAAITVQPAAQSVVSGAAASFSVTATGSSLTYQWQSSLDGATWTDIDGATTATLTLNAVTTGDNGKSIRVVVSNGTSSVTSNATILTVGVPTVSPTISTQPIGTSVVVPQAATFTVAATGTPAAEFQWKVSTDNGATYVDIPGATAASYVVAATTIADDGKLFEVMVFNTAGSVTSNAAKLSTAAVGVAPLVLTQPNSQDVLVGAQATFTITASGTPAPTYQWQVDGDYTNSFVFNGIWTNINGATSATYTTPALGLGDGAKLYRAVVTNAYGFANSSFASATVHSTGGIGLEPVGIAMDGNGALFLSINGIQADNYRTAFSGVERLDGSGGLSLIAGGGSGQGRVDGLSTFARFYNPINLIIDAAGNVYVADGTAVRKITPSGLVSTVAGGASGYRDGTGGSAQFFGAAGIVVDGAGNLYVSDNGPNAIRMVSPAGVVTTIAGLAPDGSSILGPVAFVDGTGNAARFYAPRGMAIDPSGNLYVADYGNNAIRKIAPGGVVTTLAGNKTPTSTGIMTGRGNAGFVDGSGADARFDHPQAVAVDTLGNVYVTDSGNFAIRKVTPDGTVSTLAGGTPGYVDATGAAAKFVNVGGITIDSTGNLYVTDYSNASYGLYYNAVRKISPSGAVTTVSN